MARNNSTIWKRLWNSFGIFATLVLTIYCLSDWHKLLFIWLGYFAITSFLEYRENDDTEFIDDQERFEKLKSLCEKGFITREEYKATRQEILHDL